jgi:hypothetical protein
MRRAWRGPFFPFLGRHEVKPCTRFVPIRRQITMASLWVRVRGGFVLDRATSRRHSSMLDVSVEALAGSYPGGGVCSGRHYRELRRWRWLFRLLQQQRDIRRGPLSHAESFAGIRASADQYLPGAAATDSDPYPIRRPNPHSDGMLTDGDQHCRVRQRSLDKFQCSGNTG